MPNDIHIVVYHDLSEEKCPLTGQLSLSTRPDMFRNHIAYFSKNFDFIGEDDLLSGSLPSKPLLVTFDDAYRSVLTVGVPVLKEFNAPSIFFIIPSVVQGNSLPIDNVLSFAVEEMGIKRVLALVRPVAKDVASVGDIICKSIATMNPIEIYDLKAKIFSTLGTTESAVRQKSKSFLDAKDLSKFTECGVTVGNHSMTHSHFRALSMEELDTEIRKGRAALQNLSGQAVRCLSVPYGDERDATDSAMAVARASGHEAIFLVHARSNRFRYVNDAYYRVSLRNEGLHKMVLLIKVFPMFRSIRDGFATRRIRNSVAA